ncbi:MAG: sigma-54-dependent Fis family transcriptional regulator [Bacteroidales bacterium]|nr:sigma-54-dependent Fis family transcriptional regulator [Bacteroidales bacterium]
MASILIIDDERQIRRAMRDILELEDYSVFEAPDGKEGLDMLQRQTVDLIFCDIKMPKCDGMEFLQKSKDVTQAPVVMISGHGTIEAAVECMKQGAVDYIEKPLDLNKLLQVSKQALKKDNLKPQDKVKRPKAVKSSADMIGSSKVMEDLRKMIAKVAPTDAKVLITGSNGTGKEIVAKLLHQHSLRSDKPFVEINCAAIPEELIESELFGHEKGAFTSAISKQKGKFELADGGTLFLDEIGDMSLRTQSKVLKVLQEGVIQAVGSEKEKHVDVRIISATNKNLPKDIEEGKFREDLYHRLNIIELKVPDLNDRREDIPELVDYFLDQLYKSSGKKIEINAKAVKALQSMDWRGNVRQLRNAIERLVILSGDKITEKEIKEYL